MPVIVVKAAATIAKLEVQGHEQLGSCIKRAVSQASATAGVPLMPTDVLQGSTPVLDWEAGVCVGGQDYTVLAAPAGTLLQMLHSLMDDVAALKQGQAADRAPRLRNIVAQMLLHGCGQQQYRTSCSSYYDEMLRVKDPAFLQLAVDMGVSADEVAQKADAMLTRQNMGVHPGSFTLMEQEVREMQILITPELRQRCPQECMFLEAYDTFKRAFLMNRCN